MNDSSQATQRLSARGCLSYVLWFVSSLWLMSVTLLTQGGSAVLWLGVLLVYMDVP